MSRGAAWILFGAVMVVCGTFTSSHSGAPIELMGFFVALIATIISVYGKKRD